MPQKSEDFNANNLKKILKIKNISINQLGKEVAKIKGCSDDAGIRQTRRYLHTGKIPKPIRTAIEDYLKINPFWLEPFFPEYDIMESEIKKWEALSPYMHKKLYDVADNPLDQGIKALFESQGYELIKQQDGVIVFQGKYSFSETLTEEEYQQIIQPVITAVNVSASSFEFRTKSSQMKEGKDNGNG